MNPFVVGVANKDQEDLSLEASPEFWRLINVRRRSPRLRLPDMDAELLADDS